jgi:hypothetical protein
MTAKAKDMPVEKPLTPAQAKKVVQEIVTLANKNRKPLVPAK